MKAVAVTQRVCTVPEYGERRDCLDQAWTKFLAHCGLLPVLLPNVKEAAVALCARSDIAGLLLTGGNDLASLGGEAPERDEVENGVLDWAGERTFPVLGICRGRQLISNVANSITSHRRPCCATPDYPNRWKSKKDEQLSPIWSV